MKRLIALEFGRSKSVLGSDIRANGFNITQFIMQLDRLISENGATRFLDGRFAVEDTAALTAISRGIFANYDKWQVFKNDPASAALAEYYELCAQGGWQRPAIPADQVFVSADRLTYAISLSRRSDSEEKIATSASIVCRSILKELNEKLHESIHAQLIPILAGVRHSFQKINLTKGHIEQNLYGQPIEDRRAIVEAIRDGPMAATFEDIEVLADNLTYLRRVMVEHHAMCL